MRPIAIVLSVLQIATFFYLIVTRGAPSGKDLPLAVLLIATPIATLLIFYFSGSEGWLSLYFKRKTLEERKKIERLNETTPP